MYANERTRAVLDIDRSDLIGRQYNDPEWEMRDPDGVPIPDEELPFRRVRDSGEPVDGYRFTVRGPHGTERTLLANGVPLFDDGDTVESVIFSLTDITGRKRADQRCERIIGRTRDALVEVDADWQCTLANRRAQRLSDVSGSDIRGRTVWKVFPWLETTRFADQLRRVMTTREPTEFVARSDTLDRWFDVNAYPHDGGGLSFYALDITDCKRREEALEAEYERIAAIEEVVSQDLRTAVETARDALGTLQDCADIDDASSRIEQAHTRLEAHIDDVLDLSRPDGHVSKPEKIDLAALARDCWAGIDTEQAHLQTSADRRIESDPVGLQLLVKRVLEHTVEHGSDNVTVTVGIEDDRFFVAADSGLPLGRHLQVADEADPSDCDETGVTMIDRIADTHGWTITYSASAEGGDRLVFTDVSTADERNPETS